MSQSDRYGVGPPGGLTPTLNVQQASPQGGSFGGGPLSAAQNRPIPPSALNTNIPYDPTMGQRPVTHHGGSSHSYSRSSPSVATDSKYMPYPGTPEAAKLAASSSRGFDPRTPTGGPSHSPLALADIRPQRTDMSFDDMLSPSAPAAYGSTILQKTSNYLAPWPIYAYDWCDWAVPSGHGAGKMAICSYLEDPHNFIQILDTAPEAQDPYTSQGGPNHALSFTRVAEANCSYPVTRILWEPPSTQKQTTDLLATSGDHLRLWSLPSSNQVLQSNSINRSAAVNQRPSPTQKLTPLALLSNSKTQEHTAPLTSLDWNRLSPKLIITSSIDTTCTIWDIPSLTAKTQLIAHDKEVFDVRFCASSVDTFVSCGADGSVRMFDLRSLEHSTIIYEPSDKSAKGSSPGIPSPGGQKHTLTPAPPLLRLSTSPHDSHLLATFASESNVIRVLDHRQPGQALLELHGHAAALSCMEWSPSRRGMLASGGDDSLVLYWDMLNPQNGATLPPSGTIAGADGTSWTGVGAGAPPGMPPQQQQPIVPSNANPGAGLSVNTNTAAGQAPPNGSAPATANAKGPAASWRCDFEVTNVSWGPQSDLTAQGGEWLGVVGGRAVWGVKV